MSLDDLDFVFGRKVPAREAAARDRRLFGFCHLEDLGALVSDGRSLEPPKTPVVFKKPAKPTYLTKGTQTSYPTKQAIP